MLPENSFLSLERMKRDVGEEVSKESLVSRKPLNFHTSFSKGLRGPFSADGLMNVCCSASCEGVSLVKRLQEPFSPSPSMGMSLWKGGALPEQPAGKRRSKVLLESRV